MRVRVGRSRVLNTSRKSRILQLEDTFDGLESLMIF
jgi:hypothetical protein